MGLLELGYGPFMLPQHFLRSTAIFGLFMIGVVSGISWFPRFVTHDYFRVNVIDLRLWSYYQHLLYWYSTCISRPSNYYSGLRHGLETTT